VLKLTVFPREWDTLKNRLFEYKAVCMKLRVLDDGGWTVNADGVISADNLLQQISGNG
jgi:hypothetical protein